MKPAPFDYVRASTVDEAVAALAASNGEAKVLAGGQSLVPMLNFRIVDTPIFVDINGIQGLDRIEETTDGGLRIGALARHFALETSDLVKDRFPVLHEAMKHVAHLAIRNRGTIGGSLSHADPAAELPTMAVLLDAKIITARASGGREIAAADFFVAPLTTTLEPDEIIVAVELPGLAPGTGWGFEEFAQRRGDFAVAGVSAIVSMDGQSVTESRIALMGLHDTPVRAHAAEAALLDDGIDAAAAAARLDAEPMNDLHGSADYRRHLAEVLTRRVLTAAMERAAR
ncbi:MAG: xanthine dehydrogenase family protein subunit M [Alphaproteobacteria bacterium]|nr:xanthine dehydrogenase family protein subunit M [Alphaproteobacteria bacterium]